MCLSKLWEKIKDLFGCHFEDNPVPEWPETPFILPNITEGSSTRFGLSNNYINPKNENRIFFDLDNKEEMNYDNPQKDFKIEVIDEMHASGDIVPLTGQSIEMEIFDLKKGTHLFRVDLVEYIPVCDTYAHHHVKAIYQVTVNEKKQDNHEVSETNEIVDVQVTKKNKKANK